MRVLNPKTDSFPLIDATSYVKMCIDTIGAAGEPSYISSCQRLSTDKIWKSQ